MTEQYIPGSHNEDVAALRSTQAPAVRLEALISFPAPIGLLDRGVDLGFATVVGIFAWASPARHTWPIQATAEPDWRLVTTNQT
jgi:hypothetical protein